MHLCLTVECIASGLSVSTPPPPPPLCKDNAFVRTTFGVVVQGGGWTMFVFEDGAGGDSL